MGSSPGLVTVDLGEGDTVEIRPLSRADYAAILDRYPAPQGSEGLWSDDFAPALIQACTDLPMDHVQEWWDDTTTDAAYSLFEACVKACDPGSYDAALHVLRTNPRRLLEVQTAMRAGISHHEFLQWPVASQDLALALNVVEADQCPGCGVPREDMMNKKKWRVAASACVHCRALDEARDSIDSDERGSTHVRLVRK